MYCRGMATDRDPVPDRLTRAEKAEARARKRAVQAELDLNPVVVPGPWVLNVLRDHPHGAEILAVMEGRDDQTRIKPGWEKAAEARRRGKERKPTGREPVEAPKPGDFVKRDGRASIDDALYRKVSVTPPDRQAARARDRAAREAALRKKYPDDL